MLQVGADRERNGSSDGLLGSSGGRSYSSIDDVFHDEGSHGFAKKAVKLYQSLRSTLGLNPLMVSGFVLVLATVMERVTFKVMIDHMLPYKFVLVEIISALACLLFTAVTMFLIYNTNQITPEMRQFPQAQILNMAVLDTMQFMLLVYSGAGVSPTMTVILIHTSTIFVVLGSKYVFPNRKYGSSHSYGMMLMGGAIAISLFKILCHDVATSDYYSTWSSLIYMAAACLQGLSTLYKERSLAAWSRPINLYYLSAYLFFYQFFVTIVFSFAFYIASDIFGGQMNLVHSVYYGWRCFLGSTPADANRDDDLTIYVNCSAALWVILGYVLSTFGVLVCLHNILEINNQIVPRLLSVAIGAAFAILWVYDIFFSPLETAKYALGGSVGLADVAALVLVTVGTEVYGRDPEPDVELITHYSTPAPKASAPIPAAPTATANEFVTLTRDGNSNKSVLRC